MGECLQIPEDDSFTAVKVIDCAKPHTQEIYKIGYGGEAAAESATGCGLLPGQEDAFVAIVPDATLSVIVEEGGDAGRLICVIETAERTGSIMADVATAG